MASLDLSVLIPAYNGADLLPECLARIEAAAGGLSVEAIVADNGSTDDTRSRAGRAKAVVLVEMGRNAGFSAAVNAAAARASGDVLVVLNQDVWLDPGSLRVMHGFLRGRRALAGGALRNPDGSPQPSCGPFPTLANTLWRLALPRARRKYYLRAPDRVDEVAWITGAFLGLGRGLFEELRGFDEGFFMYYEDVDLCLRAAEAGAPAHFLPGARGAHHRPYSSRRSAPDWLRRQVRLSQTRFFVKHRPPAEAAAVAALNRLVLAWNGWEREGPCPG